MTKDKSVSTHKGIHRRIFVIRERRVMLDFDLAELYGVPTRALNQAVTRNIERFPEDFMFRLTPEDVGTLNWSQIVTSSQRHRRMDALPRAFTQEGIAMLSGVLRSARAVQVNVEIMRAFVKLREAMLSHEDLTRRLDAMEKKYDGQFNVVFNALRQLIEPPPPKKRQIGFNHAYDDEDETPTSRRRR